MEFLVSEGNSIGYVDTSYSNGSNGIAEKKLVAGADITKGQVVVLSGDMTVVPSSAPSKYVLGVAITSAKSGEPIAVQTEGLMKLKATAAITAPAQVEASTSGGVVTAGGTPVKVIGIAINTAASGGDVYVKFSI